MRRLAAKSDLGQQVLVGAGWGDLAADRKTKHPPALYTLTDKCYPPATN